MGSYTRLNLGCGKHQYAGWLNVDIDPKVHPNQVVDLEKDWPWEDNTFVEVKAHMILEHIADTIHFMNELWRVCKDGANVFIGVPDWTSPLSVADPTHKKVFNAESFKYFCSNGEHYHIHASYGIKCNYWLVSQKSLWATWPELHVHLLVKK